MKYIQKIIILISGMGLMIGCQEPEYPAPTPSAGPSTESAKILFVQASPDAPSLNGLINNLQIGSSMTLGQSTPYGVVPVGANQIKASATTGDIGGVIGSGSIVYRASTTNQTNFTFINGTSYTAFVTDTINRPKPAVVAGTNPGGPQFLGPIVDNLTAPAAGKSGIRFLNLAPGSASIFLTAGGATLPGTLSTIGRSYRTTSVIVPPATTATSLTSFTAVNAGSYNLEVRTTSATGTIIATLPSTAFADGKIYTIYFSGKAVKIGSNTVIKVPYKVNLVSHN